MLAKETLNHHGSADWSLKEVINNIILHSQPIFVFHGTFGWLVSFWVAFQMLGCFSLMVAGANGGEVSGGTTGTLAWKDHSLAISGHFLLRQKKRDSAGKKKCWIVWEKRNQVPTSKKGDFSKITGCWKKKHLNVTVVDDAIPMSNHFSQWPFVISFWQFPVSFSLPSGGARSTGLPWFRSGGLRRQVCWSTTGVAETRAFRNRTCRRHVVFFCGICHRNTIAFTDNFFLRSETELAFVGSFDFVGQPKNPTLCCSKRSVSMLNDLIRFANKKSSGCSPTI